MKKKKIELSRKLFMKKDTISSLNARQSDKVVGGWATNVRETAIDPNPVPGCMSCVDVPQPQTHEQSICKCFLTNNMNTCTPGITGC